MKEKKKGIFLKTRKSQRKLLLFPNYQAWILSRELKVPLNH